MNEEKNKNPFGAIDLGEKSEEEKIVDYLVEKGIYNLEQLKELFEASYVLIPFEILKRKDLNSVEKILYAELISLSRKNGYCYATNEYLGEKIGLSKRNVSRVLKKLKEKKMIEIELIKNNEGTFRKIWVVKEGGMTSCHAGVDKIGIRDSQKCHAKRDTDKRNKQKNINIININNFDDFLKAKEILLKGMVMADDKTRTFIQEQVAKAERQIKAGKRPEIEI